jgi:serine/threonine protein kinase/tetratricopeptide (TPR) repeat protein
MTAERWQQIKEILDAALQRQPAQRAAFLQEACGRDAALRREVDSLLASAGIGEALEQPLYFDPPADPPEDGPGVPASASQPVNPSPLGRLIGPYRVLKELGRGGMGSVYLAMRDDDQFKKQVALKLLRPGMDSEDIVRRFLNERQILASIDHPNIARLLDGGSTEEGLPYFVMEFVEGKPIDEYCSSQRLSISERLRLFREVCAAVHFAHQNLVVHRDLKPANVLVTRDGSPKLLDFGIAKIMNPDLVSGLIDPTQIDRQMMTPEYASPEQVRGDAITTASDVYSMGVLLYELLTGHRPHRLKGLQFQEFARAVCEDEPTLPSEVIDRILEVPGPDGAVKKITPEGVAANRGSTRDRLKRQLRGDLDKICHMALRKEPRRRYGSVEQLSEDIGRFLEGLPVKARKPTLAYRSSKFVRRHKVGVTATVVFFVSVLSFSIFIVRERIRAEKAAAKSEAVSRFLQETLQAADPVFGVGREVTLVEVLDEAVTKIESSFPDQPEIRAELHFTIGTTYYHLGRYDKALPLLLASAETLEKELGGDQENLARVLETLSLVREGQGQNAEAAALMERVLQMREKTLPPRDPLIARALDNLANTLRAQGKYAQAEQLYKRALEIKETAATPEPESIAGTLNNLATLYAAQGRYADADPYFQRSLEMTERALGPEHPQVATLLANLGAVKVDQRKYDEAEPFLLRSLSVGEKALGPEHPSVAKTINNLGGLYVEQRRYADAEPLLRRSLDIAEKSRGREHLSVAISLNNLAAVHLKQGQHAAAEPLFWRSLRIAEKVLGPEDLFVARVLNNLAELRLGQDRYAEGERLCQRGLDIRRKAFGSDHVELGTSLEILAALAARQGRRAQAERLYAQVLALYDKAFGPQHPDSREIRQALAKLRSSGSKH